MKNIFKFLFLTFLLTICLQIGVLAEDSVSLSYNIDDGIIRISGNAGSEYAGENVSITVLQAEKELLSSFDITKENVSDFIQYADQVKVSSDGTFSSEFPIYNGVTGNYCVRVCYPGGNNVYTETIYYLNYKAITEVLGEINAALDKDGIKNIILSDSMENMIKNTAVKYISDGDIIKIAEQVFSSRPYEKITTLIEDIETGSLLAICKYDNNDAKIKGYIEDYFKKYDKNPEIYSVYITLSNKDKVISSISGQEYENIAALCENFEQNVILEYLLEQTTWTFFKNELISYSEKYPQYSMFKTLNMTGFINLSNNEQYSVIESLLKNKSNISGADRFAEVFNDYVKNVNQSSNPGGASGSGGSSGGGGNKSTASQGVGNVAMVTTPATNEKQAFTDLGNVLWAKESILELKAAGIVSGRSETEFDPSAPVKREEFIKMLISGFGLSAQSKETSFSDVDSNMWYYPYICAAAEQKIVYGDDEGRFGVGKEITREDMAVMIYRIINLQGVNLAKAEEKTEFTDIKNISSYAQDAVKALQQAGIINGMEDGSFAPKKNSTRAETAKMLYGILKTAGKI